MTILATFFAGIVGTLFMSVVMTVVHRSGWANADMIRALGSLVTRSREHAVGWGLGIHFVSGMLFAIPYTIVLSAFGGHGLPITLGLGILMGLAHGIVMSLVLLAAVSEKHPLEQFREAGFEVAVAHILGHVAYGFGVALMVAVLHIDWGFRI